MQAMQMLRRVP